MSGARLGVGCASQGNNTQGGNTSRCQNSDGSAINAGNEAQQTAAATQQPAPAQAEAVNAVKADQGNDPADDALASRYARLKSNDLPAIPQGPPQTFPEPAAECRKPTNGKKGTMQATNSRKSGFIKHGERPQKKQLSSEEREAQRLESKRRQGQRQRQSSDLVAKAQAEEAQKAAGEAIAKKDKEQEVKEAEAEKQAAKPDAAPPQKPKVVIADGLQEAALAMEFSVGERKTYPVVPAIVMLVITICSYLVGFIRIAVLRQLSHCLQIGGVDRCKPMSFWSEYALGGPCGRLYSVALVIDWLPCFLLLSVMLLFCYNYHIVTKTEDECTGYRLYAGNETTVGYMDPYFGNKIQDIRNLTFGKDVDWRPVQSRGLDIKFDSATLCKFERLRAGVPNPWLYVVCVYVMFAVSFADLIFELVGEYCSTPALHNNAVARHLICFLSVFVSAFAKLPDERKVEGVFSYELLSHLMSNTIVGVWDPEESVRLRIERLCASIPQIHFSRYDMVRHPSLITDTGRLAFELYRHGRTVRSAFSDF